MTEKNAEIGNLLRDLFRDHRNEAFLYDVAHGRQISYGDFLSSAFSTAQKLSEAGIESGDTVCLHAPNSLELLILYFVCLIKGWVAVPVDPQKGESEVKEIIEELNPACIISASKPILIHTNLFFDLSNFLYDLLPRAEIKDDDLSVFCTIDYSKLFLITYTSGSTGKSKGVMHSFQNLVLTSQAFNRIFHFDANSVFYHNLPMTYMAGILNLFILPLVTGSKIAIGERFNAKSAMDFWSWPQKYGANVFWFTPSVVSLLLKLDRGIVGVNYAAGRTITGLVGTAPLYPSVKKAFEEKYHISLYESYGLSELLFVATNSPQRPGNEGSTGQLLDGMTIRFSSDGEILADTKWMFLGYTNEKTASYFINTFYQTGDLGSIDEESNLFISGRKKDLIIRGGMNISPAKTVLFLNDLNLFEETAVLGVKDDVLGEKTVCFFVSGSQPVLFDRLKEINRQIVQQLGRDYVIDEFIAVDKIPKNMNGKTDKTLLHQIYNARLL